MRNANSFAQVMAGLMTSVLMLPSIQAQTVLSGSHVIEGSLDVGTTGTEGNLQIKGQTGSSANPGIRVTGDGGVLFEGTVGQGKIPIEGSGTRLMWYPGKSAFRVGTTMDWKFWDDIYIGQNSTAFGEAWALGPGSIAMSRGGAEGYSSTAMSNGHTYGSCSTGISEGVAVGGYSTAISGGWADGGYSIAISRGVTGGDFSTAMSWGIADGYGSTAMVFGAAYGDYSIAAGDGTSSCSYRSVVVGSYSSINSGSVSWTDWVPTDPIFVVGNGTGDSNDPPEIRNRDAFVILKNGNVKMTAKVEMPRQGDILMGEFGEPEP